MPDPTIYDDILRDDKQATNDAAAQAVATSVGNNPDQVGQAQRISKFTGIGPDAALEDLDGARRQLAVQSIHERDLASWNPMLARQLADPSFAAIAHDQLDNLSNTGTLFDRMKQAVMHPVDQIHAEVGDVDNAFSQGHNQFERGMLGIKAKRGAATAEDWQRINDLDTQMQSSPETSTLSGKVLGGVAGMTGNIIPMVPHALAVGAGGAAVGAGLGAAGLGVGALPGAAAGFGTGFESEFGARNYEMMAGNSYLDLLNRGVDEHRAQWAAGAVGAVNTALQLGIMRAAGKPVGAAVTRAFDGALGDTVAEALTKPSTAKAVQSALLQWGKHTAIGTGEMGLQTVVDRVGQDYADQKGLKGTASDLFSADFGKHLGQSLIDAALTMGTINAATGMVGFQSDLGRVQKAERDASFLENLSTSAVDSKVRERNPDAYESFIAGQAPGTGAENVYIDGREMTNLLNQSNLKSEDLEQAIPGLHQDVVDAAASGGDVTIPVEKYAARLAGTPLGDAMKAHMRLDPDAMSATEALDFQSKQKEIFDQVRQEAEQKTATSDEFSKSAKVVEKDLFQQLKATGTMPDEQARTNASFVRDFVVTQAARAGMMPEDFFDRYRYTIQRGAGGGGDLLSQAQLRTTEGRDTTLHTPSGKMPAKYVLAEANDLVPSHNASTFAINPQYPEGVQERAYDKSKEAQARVIEQAQNYEPAYTVNTNPDAVNGPPVVTKDGIVLGGNSRAMSTIRLYRNGDPTAYREALNRQAESFGLSADQVDQMKEPVLVRQVDAGEDRESLRRLGSELNKSMTGSLGEAEKAVSAGKNIKPESLRAVSSMLSDGDLSLRDLMAQQGPALVRMMVADGVITDRERPQYVDTASGGLNDAGKAFIEKALVGSVLDDPRLLEAAPKAVLSKIERSLGAITSFSYRPDEWNVLPVVRAAVAELGDIQREKSSIEIRTAQSSMFGEERNPVIDAMMRTLDKNPNAVRKAFEDYSRDADANLPGQSRMFGSSEAFDAFNSAFGTKFSDDEFRAGLERAAAAEPKYAANAAGDGALSEASSASAGAGSTDLPEWAKPADKPSRGVKKQVVLRPLAAGTRAGFDPSRLTAVLGETSDMSSFLHETAHYFLAVYGDLAKEAPEVSADFDKLLKWFGVKDQATWDAMSLDEQRKYHEQFAYSYEKYLAEGKAPSVAAQGVFDRFTQWLKRVYKSVRDDVNTIYRQQHGEDLPIMNGEVRDVMDRMLASDEQIREAQAVRNMEPVFKSQERSGMNDAEWKAYGDMATSATDEGSAELAGRSIREMQWMSTARGRLLKAMQAQHEEIRAGVRSEVRDDLVKKEPVYRAQNFMRTGELPGEEAVEDHKIDTAKLKELLPEGATAKDLFGMTKRGGLDPDIVAAASGFSDGKAMIDAILSSPSLKEAVDSGTDQRMLAEHGELATPRGMAEAVEKAVHNEARARLIAFEMRHAFNMNESERLLVKAAQRTAQQMIEREKFADINPSAYAAREARAARQAQAAAVRGDTEAVGRAKRDQLLQNALVTAALKAKDEADASLRYLNKYDRPSKSITKAIGADHMDAINQLLAGYGLSPRERYSERSERMADWINGEYSRTGVMPAVSDDLVDRLGSMHWKDMSLTQLRDLRDAVKSIDYTGRQQTKLMLGDKQMDLDEFMKSVQDQLVDMPHKPIVDIRADLKYAKGLDKLSAKFLNLKSWVKSADAALLKMEQFFQWVDAGKDAGIKEASIEGPMQSLYRLASGAEAKERSMRAESSRALRELGAGLRESKVNLDDALDVPELPRDGNIRWYRGELLSMALNMGNESNKGKMLLGYGWDEHAAVAAINRTLTAPEMSFVQGVWDHLATYGDGIRELQRRQTGVSPEMIEPTPIATKHGVFPGGYYPVVYNDVLDDRIAQSNAKNADQLFENNYARPATASGHTIGRTNYIGPLYLDLGVIARHIDQVTHDLAWREPVIEMNKALTDKRLQTEIKQVYGPEYAKQFRPWLQAMANDRVFNTTGDSSWETLVRKARSNFTMVGIGFRFSTMAIHGASALSNSIGEIGPSWFAKGVAQFSGVDRFMQGRDFVYERSPEMANRMNEADRNVHEAINEINAQSDALSGSTVARKLYDDVRKFAFRGVSMLDMGSALPTWFGAYLKGLAHEENGGLGLGEEDAIAYADRSVRNAHGGGGTKDMAAIQRDKGVMSLATMFYSYWNHVYNRQRDLGKGWQKTLAGNAAVRDFPRLMARSWFYLVIPQIAHTLLSSGGKKNDQDNSSLSGFLSEVSEGIGLGTVAGIPIIRDIANAAVHGTDYAITPLEKAGQSFVNSFKDVKELSQGGTPKRLAQDTAETLGYATGLPTAQPAATTRFLWDVINGNSNPETIADWWRGILSGKVH